MAGYEFITAKDIIGKNVFLTGGRTQKDDTCKTIIETWNSSGDGSALVVFDRSGDLYKEFGAGAPLVDLTSEGSVLPDVLGPILRHETYGLTPESTSDAIRRITAPEKPDRNSNDQFWTVSGNEALRQMVEYGLAMTRYEIAIKNGKGNEQNRGSDTLLSFAKNCEWLKKRMADICYESKQNSNTEKQRKQSGSELILAEYLYNRYGADAAPFDSTLKNTGSPGNSGTSSCIVKTAQAIGKYLLALLGLANRREDVLRKMPIFDLSKFLDNPRGKPLFVCSTADADADSALAALLFAALASAAEKREQSATVLIPELESWGLFRTLSDMRGMAFTQIPKVIAGYSTIHAVIRRDNMTEQEFFDTAFGISDLVIWHPTDNVLQNALFKDRNDVKAAIYGPCDLCNGLVAIEGGETPLTYKQAAPHTPSEAPCIRVRAKSQKTCRLWFDEAVNPSAAMEYERQLELKERAIELGLSKTIADAVLASTELNLENISRRTVCEAQDNFFLEYVHKRVLSGNMGKDELKYLACGKYEIKPKKSSKRSAANDDVIDDFLDFEIVKPYELDKLFDEDSDDDDE